MARKWCIAGVIMVLLLRVPVAAAEEFVSGILFDQGHRQLFLIEENGPLQLSGLADVIRRQGSHVKSTKRVLSDETLSGYKALVISGPFEPLLPEEVDAVARFIERGGRLAAMLHIGAPLAGLLARLDIDHSNAVLHERRNIIDTDINFRVIHLDSTPLFSGVNHISVYGAWALDPGSGSTSIARTSSAAWVDLDGDRILSRGDVIGAFPLIVNGTYGAGGFMVFGDDAIFQNRYLDDENRKLAANLASWLAGY